MKTQTNPVITGRVFVHGVLEDECSRRRTPRDVQSGDIRVHAHLDENGVKQRQRGFCRAGYSGVFRASLYDGVRWRKFMLALAVNSSVRRYAHNLERSSKLGELFRALEKLKGRSCVYRDGAFAFSDEPALTVAPPVATPAAQPSKYETVSRPPVAQAAVPVCIAAARCAPRRRRKKDHPDQLKLF